MAHFDTAGMGIAFCLHYVRQELPAGAKLLPAKSAKVWRVNYRLLRVPVDQRVIANKAPAYAHCSFGSFD